MPSHRRYRGRVVPASPIVLLRACPSGRRDKPGDDVKVIDRRVRCPTLWSIFAVNAAYFLYVISLTLVPYLFHATPLCKIILLPSFVLRLSANKQISI